MSKARKAVSTAGVAVVQAARWAKERHVELYETNEHYRTMLHSGAKTAGSLLAKRSGLGSKVAAVTISTILKIK